MPLISQFYGILIYIYNEVTGKHKMPHFHAKTDEINAAWIAWNESGEIIKIEGLR